MSVSSTRPRARRARFCVLAGAAVLSLNLPWSAPGSVAPPTAGALHATPTTAAAGSPVTLKGRVPPGIRRPVLLQRRAPGSWLTLDRQWTSPTGRFTFTTLARAATTTYRVLATRRTIDGQVHTAVQTPHRTVVTLTSFVTAVADNGRYLVDQHGDPILVKGDSPWAILFDASPQQMDEYLSTRAAQGFNTVLLSLLGNGANGGSDDGRTFDGIAPFVGGDPSQLNDDYWNRVEHFISTAADSGITVMAYPIDGWSGTSAYGGIAGSWSAATARSYGEAVGARLADHPNLIWAVGGDYFSESVANERFNGVLTGVATAEPGRDRPTTIQFQPNQTSLDDSYWDEKVDYNFVYSYALTYAVVQRAYRQSNPSGSRLPALMAEAHYEGYAGVTDRYLRSMAAWALTSGSPGEFYGSEDVWDTAPTADALNTEAVDQLSALRTAFELLDGWEKLLPDYNSAFIVGGRGTKGDGSTEYFSGNTYVTGARARDGTLAVVYLPNADRQITIDQALMGDGYTATWVDPTTGTGQAAVEGSTYRRSTPNAAGDPDWLLVLESDSPVDLR